MQGAVTQYFIWHLACFQPTQELATGNIACASEALDFRFAITLSVARVAFFRVCSKMLQLRQVNVWRLHRHTASTHEEKRRVGPQTVKASALPNQREALFVFYHAAVTKPLARDLIVLVLCSPTVKTGSCSVIQLFSLPKVSESHCMISQEPYLQHG